MFSAVIWLSLLKTLRHYKPAIKLCCQAVPDTDRKCKRWGVTETKTRKEMSCLTSSCKMKKDIWPHVIATNCLMKNLLHWRGLSLPFAKNTLLSLDPLEWQYLNIIIADASWIFILCTSSTKKEEERQSCVCTCNVIRYSTAHDLGS